VRILRDFLVARQDASKASGLVRFEEALS